MNFSQFEDRLLILNQRIIIIDGKVTRLEKENKDIDRRRGLSLARSKAKQRERGRDD